jgi:N-acetylglucosaminyldiphosphoundecaprenol N-acetyl-beta-D-mannosaminyltransferase
VKEQFFNINIDITDQQEFLEKCQSILSGERTHTLFFLNAHCFNIAQENPQYYDALRKADILLNDGIGLKLASYFRGIRFRENMNGTDMIPKIISLAAREGKKVFFLGARDGISQKAANTARQQNPDLMVSGTYQGFFSDEEEKLLIERINNSGTDVLIIGMGVPKQELWAIKNQKLLHNVKLIIAGGAILDFLSGNVSRAPVWMRNAGMEWVFRLILEPGRMWRRYLVGNVVFFMHIFRLKFRTQSAPRF